MKRKQRYRVDELGQGKNLFSFMPSGGGWDRGKTKTASRRNGLVKDNGTEDVGDLWPLKSAALTSDAFMGKFPDVAPRSCS
ncbi:hypothetical protein AAC387_Pa02g3316 [Persea americana]